MRCDFIYTFSNVFSPILTIFIVVSLILQSYFPNLDIVYARSDFMIESSVIKSKREKNTREAREKKMTRNKINMEMALSETRLSITCEYEAQPNRKTSLVNAEANLRVNTISILDDIDMVVSIRPTLAICRPQPKSIKSR